MKMSGAEQWSECPNRAVFGGVLNWRLGSLLKAFQNPLNLAQYRLVFFGCP